MYWNVSITDASFKNKKTLAGHMKTHTSEKAFKCDQCDSEFTRKASLNRHIKAAHDGEFIQCELCPETFRYRNSLQDHIKAAHNEGRREFRCDLCGVEFAVKAYLSKHMVSPLIFPMTIFYWGLSTSRSFFIDWPWRMFLVIFERHFCLDVALSETFKVKES